MPDLVGSTLSDAKAKLKENNLELGDVKEQDSNEYYSGQVISQDTDAGVQVEEGTTVNLVVSTGPGPTAKTQPIGFTLPAQQEFYRVVINVIDRQGKREEYNQLHQASDTVNTIVNYVGSGRAEVTLNGKLWKTYSL
ncbi:MAG TPA: PASTA domain-containing protein [Syntrophomonadaceae bacterium]|nr:PASTA domain-containing protein [Syntrophomonadaceae bacterium]